MPDLWKARVLRAAGWDLRITNVTSGDHVVFFGRVERATYREGEPLIFSAGRYGTHAFLD